MQAVRKISEIAAPLNANWTREWVPATASRNYLLKDPLNDWLRESKKRNYMRPLDSSKAYLKTDSLDFESFILRRGCEFEDHVVDNLRKTIGTSNVKTVSESYDARKSQAVLDTQSAMMEGVPVIHGAVLHNPTDKTYGIADLLIRSDWLDKCFEDPPHIEPVEAVRLRDPSTNGETYPPYHYIVVDVKFSKLKISVDGIHILNGGSYPAYKGQLLVYLNALNLIQGTDMKCAYILGRGMSSSSKSRTITSSDPFYMLGTINYGTRDKSYIEKQNDAIQWIRDCRSPESKDWNVTQPPLSRPELYPNMSNTMDYPYHSAKVELANKYNELTMLWNVSTKHRFNGHSHGVYSWTDERCTPNVLGIDSPFKTRILDKVLEVNQPHTDAYKKGYAIIPRYIKSNFGDWKNEQSIEFYVDFETINDVMLDFNHPLYGKCSSFVFMIGVGYCIDGQWHYKDFTVDEITLLEETKIAREFCFYIEEMASKYSVKSSKCFHWGNAEKSFWESLIKRNTRKSRSWPQNFEWIDLLKFFKEEPIAVRGSLNYGLKDIATALKKNGCIETDWSGLEECKDGMSAMLCAVRSAKDAKMRGVPWVSHSTVEGIRRYNEVDVKTLQEILKYLRDHHISAEVTEKRVGVEVEEPYAEECTCNPTKVFDGSISCRTRARLYEFYKYEYFWSDIIASRTRAKINEMGYALDPIYV